MCMQQFKYCFDSKTIQIEIPNDAKKIVSPLRHVALQGKYSSKYNLGWVDFGY